MFIYSCTSELYHPPIATIGLIVVNVLVSILAAGADVSTVQDYTLWYGNGLHPIQWVTSAFLHANATHLIGNMLFFWPLGLLVEAKIGWWKFLLLYFAISISECALEQTIMLGYNGNDNAVAEVFEVLALDPEFSELDAEEQAMIREMLETQFSTQVPSSLGASSVIFGMLAVCILWAPSSDFCVWWHFGTFEVPVLVVGGFYTLFEFWNWHTSGFGVGSAALHLLGVVSGIGVGVIYLRYGIPACDNQDLFTEMFNKSIQKQPRSKNTKSRPSKPQKNRSPQSAKTTMESSTAVRAKSIHPTMPASPANSQLPGALSFGSASVEPAVDARIKRALQAAKLGQVLEAAKIIHGVNEVQVLQQVPLDKYLSLYKQAAAVSQWQAAAVILQKSILAYPDRAESRKLQLAKVMLVALKKPRQAKGILSKVQRASLSQDQTKLFQTLVNKLRENDS